MAQIDASIPLGVRPVQIDSPVNQLAKVLQVQAMQQDQQIGRMKMDEYRRGIQESNSLNQLYATAMKPDGSVDRNVLFSGAAQRGLGSKIPALQKTFAEQDKALVDVDEKKFKLAKDRHDYFKQTVGALAQEPNLSKDMVLQAGQALVQQGILPAEMYQQSIANMPDDPMALRAKLTQALKSQMTPEQIFTVFAPKPTQIDNGQQIGFRDTNPNSPTYGQVTGGAPVQKMATPGEVMTDSRVRSEGALNRGVQIRGQDLINQRAVDSNNIASQGNVIKTETDLRKEFADLPEVKRYKAAYPSYAAIEKAARTNNPQADINLIYGLAKLYDPESVVREGEYGTIANSQAIPEWLKGQAQRLAGGGKLTAETKRQILEQAQGRILTYQDEFQKAKGAYDAIARSRQASPERVFTPVGEPVTPTVDFGSLPTAGGKPKGRGNSPSGAPRIVDFGSLK